MPDIAIQLSNGSTRLINDDSWPVIAISPPLQVREHSDGSVIVYVAIQIHGHDQKLRSIIAARQPRLDRRYRRSCL
jgi:hypothetical protein